MTTKIQTSEPGQRQALTYLPLDVRLPLLRNPFRDITDQLKSVQVSLVPKAEDFKSKQDEPVLLTKYEVLRVPNALEAAYPSLRVDPTQVTRAEEAKIVDYKLRCSVEMQVVGKESPPNAESVIIFSRSHAPPDTLPCLALPPSRQQKRSHSILVANSRIYDKKSDFFHVYKHQTRAQQQNKYLRHQDSLYLSVAVQTKKHAMFPTTLGLSQRNGHYNTLDLNGMRMGDDHLRILKEGIGDHQLEFVDIAGNRFSKEECQELGCLLKEGTKEVNFSRLPLAAALPRFLEDNLHGFSQLEVLRLKDIKTPSSLFAEFFSDLVSNTRLVLLDISENFFDDSVGAQLPELIDKENARLHELYVGKNRFSRKTGAAFFSALEKNATLAVLDFSANNLGENARCETAAAESCAASISKVLAKGSLLHLDLSGNGFSEREAGVLARSLRPNNTLFGFHFERNCTAFVDAEGYLTLPDAPVDLLFMPRKQIQGLAGVMNARPRLTPHIFRNACWLCDKWVSVELRFDRALFDREPLFIHLEIFNFSPLFVSFADGDGVVKLAYPPQRPIVYFLSEAFGYSPKCLPDSLEFPHFPISNFQHQQEGLVFDFKIDQFF